MPELNFTPEQRAAIDTRGSTVLVSAAAGSGKTRVLTERLMAYLTDAENPVENPRRQGTGNEAVYDCLVFRFPASHGGTDGERRSR